MTRKRLFATIFLIGTVLILLLLIGGAAGQEEGPAPTPEGQTPDRDDSEVEQFTAPEPAPAAEEPVPEGPQEVEQVAAPAAPAANVGLPIGYQGELQDGGVPANGPYNFRFRLYDAVSGGILLQEVTQNLVVDGGRFETTLNLGSNFDGQARWLEIAVAPDGSASYSTLSPRQELVAAPHALTLRPGAVITGTQAQATLSLGNGDPFGEGLVINKAQYGIYITNTNNDGIWINGPADDGIYVGNAGSDGYTAWNPTAHGVYAYSPGTDGVYTYAPGRFGFYALNPTSDGVRVLDAGGNGVYASTVNGASYAGYFSNSGTSGTGVFANGSRDLLLGGEGVIENSSNSSAIRLNSGGDIYFHMDNDNGGTLGDFIVYDGSGTGNASKVWETQYDRRMFMYDTAGALTYYVDADTPDGGAFMEVRGPTGSVASGGVRIEALEADTGGQIELFNDSGAATITLDAEYGNGGNGRITSEVVQITGGSDLSEQFDVRARAGSEPEEGLVVCIDAETPGALVVCDEAYDKKVAGVISGAGDVQPGLLMGQAGSVADGEHPIALTGRVYVWADAGNGAITPGDLLTSGKRMGHAMKVTDHDAAQGAILGKAMTTLEEGQGLVLVLITLQ